MNIRQARIENNEVLGIVTQVLGHGRCEVKCLDNKYRLCTIKKGGAFLIPKVKLGDIVICKKWNVQSDKKGYVIWVYQKNQAEKISKLF